MSTTRGGPEPSGHGWTFLTNHAHVLVCIAEDRSARSRDIAERVGITERAVQRIVAELCEAGYLTKSRRGRRNHYELHPDLPLRHPVEGHRMVSDLIGMVVRPSTLRSPSESA